MAATRKEYELLFQLKAALGSNFTSTFKTAMQTTKQLQGTLSDVKRVQGDISGFQKQNNAIETNKKKLGDLQAEHEKLQRELKETEQPSEALTQKLKKNEQQISDTTAKIKAQEQELEKLGDKLKNAGVNTNNLAGANQKLEAAYKRVADSQERLAKINTAQEKNAAAISATRSQLTKTVGVIGILGAAIYAGPVQSAMSFESAMADVVKVVDGLKDKSTGELTEDYRTMKKELIDLSTNKKIPMLPVELTKIAASAGQAGIARQEIVKFTEDAAKMGVAFDTTADQAGDWMAKWRTSFNMSQKDVVGLADKINMLSDSTASSAQEIANIVTKVGPLGEVAGLTSGQIAAMGAALVSVGIQDDVAATGIKKLAVEMTAGTSVTKRQAAVLDKMKISATELAKRMQTDAQGAILDFLSAINKLPKAEQTAALSDYFGTESVGAIAPLLTRLDLLKESYDQVGDSARYAGSMEREFASRSETTENKIIIAKNSLTKLSMVLGDTFLPYIGQAAEKVSELVTRFADFAEKNPKLVMTIAKVVAGLLAFKVGALGLKMGFLEIKGASLAVQKVFTMFSAGAAKMSAEALTHTGALSKLATGMKSYFGGVKGAAGGVSTAFSGAFGGSKAAGIFKTMTGGISKVFGSFGGAITGVFASAGGKAVKIFGTVGSTIAKGPLGKIGSVVAGGFGKLTKVLGPVGKLITTVLGPLAGIAGGILPVIGVIAAIVAGVQILFGNLDKVHGFIEAKFGKEAADAFSNIMNVVKNVGETIKNIFSDDSLEKAKNFLVNIFGGKSEGVIDGVISMVKVVRNIIGDFIAFCNTYVRPIIEMIFKFIVEEVLPIIAEKVAEWLPKLSAMFQSLWEVIKIVAIGVMKVIQAVFPIIKAIVVGVIKIISVVIGTLITVIGGLIEFIAGVFTGDWSRAWEGIKQIFGGIWNGIKEYIAVVWEAIKNIFGATLNVIAGIWSTIWEGIKNFFIGIWQAIKDTVVTHLSNIVNILVSYFTGAFEAVKGVFGVFVSTITTIFNNVKEIFTNVIDFVKNVFTGNWQGAWENVKNIFKSIFDTFAAIAKAPINAVIALINGAIKGINKLNIKIPDWVPMIGGKAFGINIPEIAMLAKGSKHSPSTFIAGEKGPELITNAPGRTVYTARETQSFLQFVRSLLDSGMIPAMAGAGGLTYSGGYNTPAKVGAVTNTGGMTITIHNSPTIQVDGAAPDDLDAKLQRNNENLLNLLDARIHKKQDDERRQRYE